MKGRGKGKADPERYACPKCGEVYEFAKCVLDNLSAIWAHSCSCGQQSILVNGTPCAVVSPITFEADS